MIIAYDAKKRLETLTERKLDFCDFPGLFEGEHLQRLDSRHDYGEPRYIVLGFLGKKLVCAVYTLRNKTYRVISMRKANEREKAYFDHEIKNKDAKAIHDP